MLDNEIVPDNKELEEKILEKDMSKTNWSLKDTLPSLIYWPLLIAQISMVFFYYNFYKIEILAWFGWGVFILFFIIGGMPRYEFTKKGEIEDGKSFVYTTKLVDTGIYAIIRHPIWLTWILLSLSVTLMSQYWIMVLMGITIMVVVYLETFHLDKALIKKFGTEYEEYKRKVPRLNIVYGLIKYSIRRKK